MENHRSMQIYRGNVKYEKVEEDLSKELYIYRNKKKKKKNRAFGRKITNHMEDRCDMQTCWGNAKCKKVGENDPSKERHMEVKMKIKRKMRNRANDPGTVST